MAVKPAVGGQQSDRMIVVAGTRPEAIKLAPVILALREVRIFPHICLTGQHPELAREALAEFGLFADHSMQLMCAGQSLAALNERAVVSLAALFSRERPRWVIVHGDTSSALCASIAARQAGIAIAHVEAGLRSFDREAPFPEEINRVLIARLAHLHFAPTPGARANLLAEGVQAGAIEVTGNTIVDALRWIERQAIVPADAPTGRRLIVATTHRRENRGKAMEAIVGALAALAARGDVDIIVPIHPGTPEGLFEPIARHPSVRLLPPLPYAEFAALVARAHLVITDSGGIQEEASALGIPTLIARRNTERPEVVEAGTARIVGLAAKDIVAAATTLIDDPAAHRRMAQASNRIGDGFASRRIVGRLQRELRAPIRTAA